MKLYVEQSVAMFKTLDNVIFIKN